MRSWDTSPQEARALCWIRVTGAGALLLLAACKAPEPATVPDHMTLIAGGVYQLGSDSAERELGYELSPPAVRGYGWYDDWEAAPHRVTLELADLLSESRSVGGHPSRGFSVRRPAGEIGPNLEKGPSQRNSQAGPLPRFSFSDS